MAERKYSRKPSLTGKVGLAKAPAPKAMYGGVTSARPAARKAASKVSARRRKK